MQSLPTHSETTVLSASHHDYSYSQQQNHHPATVIVSDLSSIQGEQDDTDNDETSSKPEKRSGRRNIKIEYIEDKSRRHITFSKRKAGIMKKAYELSTLTGTQILLLVVSETGLVYTFTTPKLQPLVTKQEGKNLIQSCLNAPDDLLADTQPTVRQPKKEKEDMLTYFFFFSLTLALRPHPQQIKVTQPPP
ncbi:SRF-type transcription factor (DNA-binding and dimerization domain)-domain-containing protein [Absidia repens]|uniref:SRF-type transcription factor (DNA-binding and dimerization domain)-domain-containing protein n=1 Tax=Absidia repens TaxID=90262 RepID=A0A1X2IG96_9FUNG|nr:SRF-type transcription factor (DNA-binding and dimerization domain)-domain-containing protein [Absidia repens]